jgi:hypothetical protein
LVVVGNDYCYEATIIDLQVKDVSVKEAQFAREVGIRFDKRVKENALLVR